VIWLAATLATLVGLTCTAYIIETIETRVGHEASRHERVPGRPGAPARTRLPALWCWFRAASARISKSKSLG